MKGFFSVSALVLAAISLTACVTLATPGTPQKIPITNKGELSTVVLSLVERQNFIIDGEKTYNHPDGLVFYFVIYPAVKDHSRPTIKEYQNFTIDGNPYWRNQSGSVDSYTVIYNEKTFEKSNPQTAVKIKVEKDKNALIQKTIICGEMLPPSGSVEYLYYVGFEQELEEFEFLFRLQDVL
jgi:hypothetical protein